MFEPKVKELEEFNRIWESKEASHSWTPTKFKREIEKKEGLKISPQSIMKWVARREKGVREFNPDEFLKTNKEEIYSLALQLAKKGNQKAQEMLLKLAGDLKQGKEEKVEYSNIDVIRDYDRFIKQLREGFRDSNGICPCCLRPKSISK